MSGTLAGARGETRWLGRVHEHHKILDSTNDRALAWARAGAPHGALVTADEQSAGRGRLGRSWHSPSGANLYATIVLRPPSMGPQMSALGLAVGLGIYQALAPDVPDLGLKWPNDLVHGGRKLGGILCEARWQGTQAEVVAGFGINVGPQGWPPELEQVATSLAQCAAGPWERDAVLTSILRNLEPVLDRFFAQGFGPLRAAYEAACVSVGAEVLVSDRAGAKRRLYAESIDDEGALWARAGAGALERIPAADLL